MTQKSGRLRVFLVLLSFRLVVASIVVVWSPHAILSTHPAKAVGHLRVLALAGLLLMTLGCIAYVRSAWDFAFGGRSFAPGIVVAAGAYRCMRNPMYLGLVLILLGEGFLFESWILMGYAAVLWGVLHLFVTFYEEPAFGEEAWGCPTRSTASRRLDGFQWFAVKLRAVSNDDPCGLPQD